MRARHRHARPGSLVPGLLLLLLFTVPAAARSSDYYGPIYTTPTQIALAQSVLKTEGYLSPARATTGQMDEATIDALREFQRDHFVPANGLLDHETMAQLTSHDTAAMMAMGRSTRDSRSFAGKESDSSAPEIWPHDQEASLRMMPETGSPVPLMTGLGALLLAGGFFLSRRSRV